MSDIQITYNSIVIPTKPVYKKNDVYDSFPIVNETLRKENELLTSEIASLKKEVATLKALLDDYEQASLRAELDSCFG